MPKRERRLGILAFLFFTCAALPTAHAQKPVTAPVAPRVRDAGADARASIDAGRADAAFHPGPVTGSEALPPGHPTMPADDGDDSDDQADPHAAAANPHQSVPGMFRAPQDTVEEDPSIPSGLPGSPMIRLSSSNFTFAP